MSWALGVTTVPERVRDLLPRTLASLSTGGFKAPHLFVDGLDPFSETVQEYRAFGLPVTPQWPRLRAYGNWVVALWGLYARYPLSQLFALFQDDVVTGLNLRGYLEGCSYPDGKHGRPAGYWNLYTVPENEKLAPAGRTGWFPSNQRGWGAPALVFGRDCVLELLSSRHMALRPLDAHRGHRSIDGGVVTALAKAGVKEYCHSPSLVQHVGVKSTLGHVCKPGAASFRGEEFDLLSLL